jgi:hypothetical protein
VTDGTHTARVALKGNYTTSSFTASSDGHGGTLVVDPKTKPVAAPLPHSLIAAMACLGAPAGGAIHSRVGPSAPALLFAIPHTVAA